MFSNDRDKIIVFIPIFWYIKYICQNVSLYDEVNSFEDQYILWRQGLTGRPDFVCNRQNCAGF